MSISIVKPLGQVSRQPQDTEVIGNTRNKVSWVKAAAICALSLTAIGFAISRAQADMQRPVTNCSNYSDSAKWGARRLICCGYQPRSTEWDDPDYILRMDAPTCMGKTDPVSQSTVVKALEKGFLKNNDLWNCIGHEDPACQVVVNTAIATLSKDRDIDDIFVTGFVRRCKEHDDDASQAAVKEYFYMLKQEAIVHKIFSFADSCFAKKNPACTDVVKDAISFFEARNDLIGKLHGKDLILRIIKEEGTALKYYNTVKEFYLRNKETFLKEEGVESWLYPEFSISTQV